MSHIPQKCDNSVYEYESVHHTKHQRKCINACNVSFVHIVRRTAFDLGKHDSRDVRKTSRHTIKTRLRYKREQIWALPLFSSNDKTVDHSMVLISSYLTSQWHKVPLSHTNSIKYKTQFKYSSVVPAPDSHAGWLVSTPLGHTKHECPKLRWHAINADPIIFAQDLPPLCRETSRSEATCSRGWWDRVWSGRAERRRGVPPHELAEERCESES